MSRPPRGTVGAVFEVEPRGQAQMHVDVAAEPAQAERQVSRDEVQGVLRLSCAILLGGRRIAIRP